MRDIIFRGKTPNGEWAHGDLRQYASGAAAIKNSDFSCIAEVLPDTIGQYSGMTDNGSKPIFEGDILHVALPATVTSREFVWPLMPVEFHEGAFGVWLSQREFAPLRSFASRVEFAVVGNIHDNPDLLKGGNGNV